MLRQRLLFSILGLAAAGLAAAAPGEVANLRFESKTTLSWDTVAGAAAYHVYDGDLATLPDYGACLIGSVPSLSAEITSVPAPGTGRLILVSSWDPSGESGLGDLPGGVTRDPSPRCGGSTPGWSPGTWRDMR